MSGETELVIGGAGCVGAAVAEALRDAGRKVRVLDLVASDVADVEVVVGDMGDRALLARALEGVQAVYQCAAFVSLHPGNRDRLWDINVLRNRVVLEESRRAGVRSFVYASTQVLCCKPGEALFGIDESVPYSTTPVSEFAASRIQSEKDVLAADAPDAGFRSVALRVPTTWGPRDRYHLPTHLWLSDHRLAVRLGEGRHCSQVYVENVAHAFALAGDALRDGRVGGRAYYVSDETPPVSYWDTMSELLVACGRSAPRVRIPTAVFAPLVDAVDTVYRRLGDRVRLEPWVSHESLAVGALDCWFRTDAIRRDLRYVPKVARCEGIRRTAAWFDANPEARAWG